MSANTYFPPAGVCIAGANSSLGRAAARRFVQHGVLVVAVDSSAEVLSLGEELGTLCEPLAADLLSKPGRHDLWSALRAIGGVDHVISLADQGLSAGDHEPAVIEGTSERFAGILESVVVGAWCLVDSTISALQARPSANRSITFTLPTLAPRDGRLPATAAARAGLVELSRALSATLVKDGIRVENLALDALRASNLPGHRVSAIETGCVDSLWRLTQLKESSILR